LVNSDPEYNHSKESGDIPRNPKKRDENQNSNDKSSKEPTSQESAKKDFHIIIHKNKEDKD
jgi:hypothetical protein